MSIVLQFDEAATPVCKALAFAVSIDRWIFVSIGIIKLVHYQVGSATFIRNYTVPTCNFKINISDVIKGVHYHIGHKNK